MDRWIPSGWMAHHGVKGQKWGVRRTPEELGHKPPRVKPPIAEVLAKSRGRSTIVRDAIRSGQVSKTINREKQMRHTIGGHPPGRSYIHGGLEYAQRLVDELSGSGEAITKNGAWTHKERVISSRIIGTHVEPSTNKETTSKQAIIVYSKTGCHIYPGKDE